MTKYSYRVLLNTSFFQTEATTAEGAMSDLRIWLSRKPLNKKQYPKGIWHFQIDREKQVGMMIGRSRLAEWVEGILKYGGEDYYIMDIETVVITLEKLFRDGG